MRIAAASGVLLSHSFPLSAGRGVPEPLLAATRGQATLGTICVSVFFAVSGMLVVRSAAGSGSAARFVRSRALRTLPAFAVVLIACAFLLGPIVTTLPAVEYFTHPDTLLHVPRNLRLVNVQWGLPGVFETNAYPAAVNGSLWSLSFEIGCYATLAALVALRGVRAPVFWAVWIAASAATVLPGVPPLLALWGRLAAAFAGGGLLYLHRDRVRRSGAAALICGLVVAAAAACGTGLHVALAGCGAYLAFCAGFPDPVRTDAPPRRMPDISYGIYLWAFPVQQTISHCAGGSMAWWANALLAAPPVGALAWASWTFVEEPFLRSRRPT